MMWEHEPQENTALKKKKLVKLDFQNVNSLCPRHHYIMPHVVLCFYRVIDTQFQTNQHMYFLSNVF